MGENIYEHYDGYTHNKTIVFQMVQYMTISDKISIKINTDGKQIYIKTGSFILFKWL